MIGSWSNPYFSRFPKMTREIHATVSFINPPTIDEGILLSDLANCIAEQKIQAGLDNIRNKRQDSYNAAWEAGKAKQKKKQERRSAKQKRVEQTRIDYAENMVRRQERNEMERWHWFLKTATPELIEYSLDMGYFGWHYAETDFYGKPTGRIACAHWIFPNQMYVGRMKLWEFRKLADKELTCVDRNSKSQFIKEIPSKPTILMLADRNPVLTIDPIPVTLDESMFAFIDEKRRAKFKRKCYEWSQRFNIPVATLLSYQDLITLLTIQSPHGQEPTRISWADFFNRAAKRTQLAAIRDEEGVS